MKYIITEEQLKNGYDMYISYLFGKLKKKKNKTDTYWVNSEGIKVIIYRNNCYFVNLSIKREVQKFFQISSDEAWSKIHNWLNNTMEHKSDCLYGKTDEENL